jgi:hypothetical protein
LVLPFLVLADSPSLAGVGEILGLREVPWGKALSLLAYRHGITQEQCGWFCLRGGRPRNSERPDRVCRGGASLCCKGRGGRLLERLAVRQLRAFIR